MTDGHIRPVAPWWVGQESRTTVEFAICKVATMPQLGIIRIIGRYWITPFDGPAARFNRSKLAITPCVLLGAFAAEDKKQS
jgi:hypothetical protein